MMPAATPHMLHACGCLLQYRSSMTPCEELRWRTATCFMLLISCCLLMTAGEGHKVHAKAEKTSEAAVHKGAAESSLDTGGIGEKGVVDKGSHGANGEACISAAYHLTSTPPLTHQNPIP